MILVVVIPDTGPGPLPLLQGLQFCPLHPTHQHQACCPKVSHHSVHHMDCLKAAKQSVCMGPMLTAQLARFQGAF